jgi:Fe-S cluster assembly scaffold protein SufB
MTKSSTTLLPYTSNSVTNIRSPIQPQRPSSIHLTYSFSTTPKASSLFSSLKDKNQDALFIEFKDFRSLLHILRTNRDYQQSFLRTVAANPKLREVYLDLAQYMKQEGYTSAGSSSSSSKPDPERRAKMEQDPIYQDKLAALNKALEDEGVIRIHKPTISLREDRKVEVPISAAASGSDGSLATQKVVVEVVGAVAPTGVMILPRYRPMNEWKKRILSMFSYKGKPLA